MTVLPGVRKFLQSFSRVICIACIAAGIILPVLSFFPILTLGTGILGWIIGLFLISASILYFFEQRLALYLFLSAGFGIIVFSTWLWGADLLFYLILDADRPVILESLYQGIIFGSLILAGLGISGVVLYLRAQFWPGWRTEAARLMYRNLEELKNAGCTAESLEKAWIWNKRIDSIMLSPLGSYICRKPSVFDLFSKNQCGGKFIEAEDLYRETAERESLGGILFPFGFVPFWKAVSGCMVVYAPAEMMFYFAGDCCIFHNRLIVPESKEIYPFSEEGLRSALIPLSRENPFQFANNLLKGKFREVILSYELMNSAVQKKLLELEAF